MKNARASAASLALALLLTSTASAQEPTFRSQSNVVLVPALIKDAAGKILYGLHASDFIVEDNGVEQTIQLDEEAEAQPISLVVAVQTGRRADHELPRMKGLASMLDPILTQQKTRAAVVTFDSGIELAQEFTGDPDAVEKKLANLQSGDGGAAILDAVEYSVHLLNEQPQERQRVLLLISETRDHGSRSAKLEDVIRSIGDSNVTVYTLAFSPALSNILDTERGSNKDEMSPGPDLLAPLYMTVQALRKNAPKEIAAMTGGEYELFESRNRFETHVNDFDNHLHSRYLLSFQPKDPSPGLHEIRVRLRTEAHASVLARSSYWAENAAQ